MFAIQSTRGQPGVADGTHRWFVPGHSKASADEIDALPLLAKIENPYGPQTLAALA